MNNYRTLPYFTNYEVVSDKPAFILVCDFKTVFFKQIRNTIADVVIALGVGAFWALAFEYPGVNIEQAVFNRERKER